MRGERREFFPEHAGKGSLLSSYEAETGTLWMFTVLSCFLLSGDRYVGELLELQQGPPLELGGGNWATVDVGGALVLPLEWSRVCRRNS